MVLVYDPGLSEALELAGTERATLVCDRPLEAQPVASLPRIPWSEVRPRPEVSRVVVLSLRAVSPWSLGRVLAGCAADAVCYLVTGQRSWVESNRRGALALSVERALRRTVARVPGARRAEERLGLELDPPWKSLRASCTLPAALAALPRGAPSASTGRVVHYIGGLGPGGAERQLTLLAGRTQARGVPVEVWTANPLVGSTAHYLPQLQRAGVLVRSLAEEGSLEGTAALRRAGAEGLREHLRADALVPLAGALARARPDVLHCWLDEANALGGIAGLALHVPRVVLSTRNVSPEHLPRLLKPWFLPAYRALAASPRVRLLANSAAGARDYARWVGVDPQRFACVYNGLSTEALRPLSAEERATRRALMGFPADAFVVVGAFRLAPEKRPKDFVQVLARLRERVPGLRAIHLGVGELGRAVELEARREGLGEVLTFRGRVADPQSYLQVADASLLTSEQEGCPNVVLESQALGVPVVATRAGGTPETVLEGQTGWLSDVGDVDGLAAHLLALADDSEGRVAAGAAGREFVEQRFGVARMVHETLAHYGTLLGAPAAPRTLPRAPAG